MKKFARTSIYVLALAIAGCTATPMFAAPVPYQDQDRDHAGQNHDRDDRRAGDHDDSAFYNNRYYKQGWQDGQHHKHNHKKWKNDADRQAYEAGYGHGDHGEQWQNHHDHDRDHR